MILVTVKFLVRSEEEQGDLTDSLLDWAGENDFSIIESFDDIPTGDELDMAVDQGLITKDERDAEEDRD